MNGAGEANTHKVTLVLIRQRIKKEKRILQRTGNVYCKSIKTEIWDRLGRRKLLVCSEGSVPPKLLYLWRLLKIFERALNNKFLCGSVWTA